MKTTKGLVSILICTYNASSTISQTLLSCLQQTYNNIEILIHDDQSIDNTLKTIQEINDSRVFIIHSGKKLGPYGGLNFLLDSAKGEYIAIQDHDDIWHTTKLEQQIEFLESNVGQRYIGCGTKTLMWYESDQRGFEYFLGKENYYTIHPSLVFRNQGQRYPTNSIYMNDALFQKVILCRGKKNIYNINAMLTFHRIKDGASNFSYKRFKYSRNTIFTIIKLHPLRYSICIIGRETLRKIVYPIFRIIKTTNLIDKMERKPFEILGNKIGLYNIKTIKKLGFNL